MGHRPVDYEARAKFIKEQMTIQEIAGFLRTIDEVGDRFLQLLRRKGDNHVEAI